MTGGDSSEVGREEDGGIARDWKSSTEYQSLKRFRLVSLSLVLLATLVAGGAILSIDISRRDSVENAHDERARVGPRLTAQSHLVQSQQEGLDLTSFRDNLALTSPLSTPESRQAALQDIKNAQDQLQSSRLEETRLATEAEGADRASDASEQVARGTVALWLFLVVAVACMVGVVAIAARYYKDEKVRQFETNAALNILAAIPVRVDNDLKLAELWDNNKQQLQQYHQIVLNYAQAARQMTQVALILGFSFLVVLGLLAVLSTNPAAAVASSVVAGAGAAVTGFIVRAILRNSETSAGEVARFFAHPIEVERALAAERIVDSMSPDERDAAKIQIVGFLTRQENLKDESA